MTTTSTTTTTTISSDEKATTTTNLKIIKWSEKAHELYTKTFAESTIVDKSNEFPQFAVTELTLGPVLGKGGFGVVSEIRAFDLAGSSGGGGITTSSSNAVEDDTKHKEGDALNDLEFQGRLFIAQHCVRINGTSHDARYALKQLKDDLPDNIKAKGLADMAIETHMLSAMEHPNIVKLRATSLQGRYHMEYFIVMDRLYDTLDQRILQWAERAGIQYKPTPTTPALPTTHAQTQQRAKKSTGGLLGCLFGTNKKPLEVTVTSGETLGNVTTTPSTVPKLDPEAAKKLLEERLVAAFDLAAALSYLHQRNIIYRDLKPENCAFDVRGDVKLFDFGTAKELPHQTPNLRDKTFQLTGVTGSLPYMAPEVAKTEPYNHKCDVFSFAVLLWQLMALQLPFAEYETDLRKFWEDVHNGPHKRPAIPRKEWPKPIELCLKRSWAQTPTERMEMAQMEGILKQEIVRVRQGKDDGLRHDQRRSTFVFRGKR